MEQIFPSIDTHREKRVELGVLIESTTSACYGSVRPEAAPFSTRPRTGGLGCLQSLNSKMPMTANAQSSHWGPTSAGVRPKPQAVTGPSRISGDRFYLRRTGAIDPLLSFMPRQPMPTLQRLQFLGRNLPMHADRHKAAI